MIARLKDVLNLREIPFREYVSAATLSTFALGGPVSLVIEPRCIGELIEAAMLCKRCDARFWVVGRGSNVVFADEMADTVLIRTVYLDAVRETPCGVRAECGATMMALSHDAACRGFGDLVFACGIPGTLGGALFMNAGAYGKNISELVKSVTALDLLTGEIKTILHHQLNYSYRNSVFQSKKLLILSAELRFCECRDRTAVFSEMRSLNRARRNAQPLDLPSGGSAFKRPCEQLAVGRLLEELGLKGMRRGNAAVSEKHAGFLVNLGGAKASDVTQLIREIQKIAEKERGIRLEPELRFIPEMK